MMISRDSTYPTASPPSTFTKVYHDVSSELKNLDMDNARYLLAHLGEGSGVFFFFFFEEWIGQSGGTGNKGSPKFLSFLCNFPYLSELQAGKYCQLLMETAVVAGGN